MLLLSALYMLQMQSLSQAELLGLEHPLRLQACGVCTPNTTSPHKAHSRYRTDCMRQPGAHIRCRADGRLSHTVFNCRIVPVGSCRLRQLDGLHARHVPKVNLVLPEQPRRRI